MGLRLHVMRTPPSTIAPPLPSKLLTIAPPLPSKLLTIAPPLPSKLLTIASPLPSKLLTIASQSTIPLPPPSQSTIPLPPPSQSTIPLPLPSQSTIPLPPPSQSFLPPSDHSCYILRSTVSNRAYVGYTIDFPHRIRQHNGEIKGGAKRTQKWRPWTPICIIRGFYDASSALRFEYRLQHPGTRRKAGVDAVMFTLQALTRVINVGDGSIAKDNKMAWPPLQITWCLPGYSITHPRIVNLYRPI